MLWRRDILEAGGGIEALGAEIAEDAAATKLINAQGLNAHLVDQPFQQPLGRRRLKDVWYRQVRWARLRRATFPLFFLPEIFDDEPVHPRGGRRRRAAIRREPVVARRRGGGLLVRRRGPPRLRGRLAALRGECRSHGSFATSCCRWCSPKPGPATTIVWRGNAMNVEETMFSEAEFGAAPADLTTRLGSPAAQSPKFRSTDALGFDQRRASGGSRVQIASPAATSKSQGAEEAECRQSEDVRARVLNALYWDLRSLGIGEVESRTAG